MPLNCLKWLIYCYVNFTSVFKKCFTVLTIRLVFFSLTLEFWSTEKLSVLRCTLSNLGLPEQRLIKASTDWPTGLFFLKYAFTLTLQGTWSYKSRLYWRQFEEIVYFKSWNWTHEVCHYRKLRIRKLSALCCWNTSWENSCGT